MAWRHLGETFDVHGGGIDLLFPHHENELAQSRCALGVERMAQVWMHNGFLQVEGRKMAKSEGNFVTIRELLQDWGGYAWPGEALRFNLLRTHYRQPMNWTYEGLDEAHGVLWNWYTDLAGVKPAPTVPEPLISALMDDLNTAAATTVLHNLRRENDMEGLLSALQFFGLSGQVEKIGRRIQASTSFAASGRFTTSGVLSTTEGADHAAFEDKILEKVDARNSARKAKNFKEADRIRDELAAMGVELHDTKEGTTWEVKR
jgi:cysteinyl-tRNA synthetase